MQEDILIRKLHSMDDMIAVEELQALVWPSSDVDIVPAHICLPIAENGGLVLGAFDGDQLIGFLLGFLGTDPESDRELAMTALKHCSHQLGVHPKFRNRGVGYQLKSAQRDHVLGQGVNLVTWTYDPLLSVNAHLNIRRLGAVCQTYIRNAYGTMRDELNEGVASDRFRVDWWVSSHRVKVRLAQSKEPLTLEDYTKAEIQVLNPTKMTDDHFRRPAEDLVEPSSVLAMVEIPIDYDHLRRENLELAEEWRSQTREAFEYAFQSGYIVTDFVFTKSDQAARSFYVLTYGEATLG